MIFFRLVLCTSRIYLIVSHFVVFDVLVHHHFWMARTLFFHFTGDIYVCCCSVGIFALCDRINQFFCIFMFLMILFLPFAERGKHLFCNKLPSCVIYLQFSHNISSFIDALYLTHTQKTAQNCTHPFQRTNC